MLKGDFHIHTGEDVYRNLGYTSYQLIDTASNLGFEVLAITNHRYPFLPKEVENYAKKKGIIIFSGCEKRIEEKEVILINLTIDEAESCQTFDDLRKLKKKKKDLIVLAPHPYFMTKRCLGKELERNIDLFDAIEYCHFYLPWINRNKKAMQISTKYSKPMLGTSDAHNLKFLNTTYTLLDCKKNKKDIVKCIKNGQVKVITKPIKLSQFIEKTAGVFFDFLK